MPVNDDEPPDNPLDADGYAAAAPQYWTAGWRGILPMPRGQKFPPPTNYTGYQALTPSYPDIQTWCDERPDGNIALHLPGTVIGVDVDSYEGKTGAGTLAYAEHLWGALPPTVRTTSRDDPYSGIRLYRVPDGTRLATKIEFPDLGLGHIEIIQASHRYAVVWPSLHPNGARYRWQDAQGYAADIPQPHDLPDLPRRWIDNLHPGSQVDGLETVDIAQAIDTLTGGEMDQPVIDRLNKAVGDLPGASSRHDTTCAHVLAFLRLSEQHYAGVQKALGVLGESFVQAVISDGSRTEQQARAEYARMVYNERGHALIAATPTNVADIIAISDQRQAAKASVAEAQVAEDGVRESPPGDIALEDDEFWSSRDFLKQIREQAYVRLASPWSVLGVTMCRALAQIPPWVTLPPIIGGRGSLNFFCAIVGRSGAGKGISEAVAAELLPFDELDNIGTLPAGSGEGLAHAYVIRRGKDSAEGPGIERIRNACLFSVPEVDTLSSIGGRQGSTIMSKLRSAYSGEEIGFSYADPTKRLLVGAHNYRMTMVLGVQPERAAPLFGDTAGGTPQRFVWLPANDPRIGDEPGQECDSIAATTPKEWGSYPRCVDVPDIAVDVIRNAHIARAKGVGDALDGHALQTREKVMVALCALDGRTTPDDWDWVLAGVVMNRSDRTREAISEEMAAAAEREWTERGRALGVSRDASEIAAAERKASRVAEVIVRLLVRKGPSLTGAEVHRLVTSRDREAITEATAILLSQGRVTVEALEDGHRISLAEVSK